MSARPPRSVRIGALAAALVAATTTATVVGSAGPAAAYPTSTVNLTGHGYGHGRGMGQYGAFGAAVSGSSYQQILAGAYGTLASGARTHLGTLANTSATNVRVAIGSNAGNWIIVTAGAPFTVQGRVVPAGGSAWFDPVNVGTAQVSWTVSIDTNPDGCSPLSWQQIASGVTNPVATPSPEGFPTDANLAGKALQLCNPGGGVFETMRGAIAGTVNSNFAPRTINVVPLEQYVADVTPSESPASWGTVGGPGPQGEPWGFQSTEAQAVAARSYVMASYPGGYFGYADTCDTTACQSYPGIAHESALSNQAVVDTAGVAVMAPDNSVLATEYSASTGGYSEQGTFAAAPDPGDGACGPAGPCGGVVNPYHSYSASVPVAALQSDFPSIGTLQSIRVTSLLAGGRVASVTLGGTSGSVTVSGTAFAGDVAGQVSDVLADGEHATGIISDFFSVDGQPSGGTAGYWLADSAGDVYPFGNAPDEGSMAGIALNAPVVGMAATADHRGYWLDASDGGVFAFGDAAFSGSMGGQHLNEPMVGMAPDPHGGYWLVASDGGIFAFGGAGFFGSMGASHLNAPVVGMAATADGGGYWLVASDGGIFAFGDAAFLGSMGATPLNRPVVGMARGPGGYWLVASDGGVFAFGTPYEGSLPGSALSGEATALMPTGDGNGYLITTADGHAYPFGDAPQFGDVAGFSGRLVGGATVPG